MATTKKASKGSAKAEPKKAKSEKLGKEQGADIKSSHPLISEGNDFQGGDENEELVEKVESEEADIIRETASAKADAGGRTEPTRNGMKPVNFGKSEEELEDEENAKEAAAAKAAKAPKAAPKGATASAIAEAEAVSDIQRTKAALAAAPTTKFIIPLDPAEKFGAVETVTINGYRLSIRKGEMVTIPVPVAEILMGYLNVRSEVAERLDVHRDSDAEDALT